MLPATEISADQGANLINAAIIGTLMLAGSGALIWLMTLMFARGGDEGQASTAPRINLLTPNAPSANAIRAPHPYSENCMCTRCNAIWVERHWTKGPIMTPQEPTPTGTPVPQGTRSVLEA